MCEAILGFGLKIPYWHEVKAMALQTAGITPQLRYASWDITVTPDGPLMIEGNWDAEFYAEQMRWKQGNVRRYIDKLDDRG